MLLYANHNAPSSLSPTTVGGWHAEMSGDLPHVTRGGCAEPVVREDAAAPEVGPVVLGTLYGKVPVRQGDGRVNGLQRLLEHEGYGDVGCHEPGTIVPVVAVLSPSWCTRKQRWLAW